MGSRAERFFVGVSVMSGCPIGCRFCATGKLKRWRKLTAEEMVAQVLFILERNPDIDPAKSKEFKVNWTRMGEVGLNLEEVMRAIDVITDMYPNVHHYVSTIGIPNFDFSWVKDNITLQISLHSLDEERRRWLIPAKTMSIEQLGQIRTSSNLKTTINLTLMDRADFDIELLRKYFDPKHFFIKLSPINKNDISDANDLGAGIIVAKNII